MQFLLYHQPSHLILSYIMCLLATGAVNTGAAITTLAAALVLGCWNLHHNGRNIALLGLYDVDAIAVSLLHALALVSAVAVAAGRHG